MNNISSVLDLAGLYLKQLLIVVLPFIGIMLILSELLRGWSIATGVVCLIIWRELF